MLIIAMLMYYWRELEMEIGVLHCFRVLNLVGAFEILFLFLNFR